MAARWKFKLCLGRCEWSHKTTEEWMWLFVWWNWNTQYGTDIWKKSNILADTNQGYNSVNYIRSQTLSQNVLPQRLFQSKKRRTCREIRSKKRKTGFLQWITNSAKERPVRSTETKFWYWFWRHTLLALDQTLLDQILIDKTTTKKKVIVCYYQQHLIDTDIIRVQTLHTIPTVKSNIWFHLSFPLQNALNNWWDSIGRPSIRCYFSSYNWGQWTKTNRSNENIMGKYRKRKVYIPFPFYVGRNIEFWSNTTTKHIS